MRCPCCNVQGDCQATRGPVPGARPARRGRAGSINSQRSRVASLTRRARTANDGIPGEQPPVVLDHQPAGARRAQDAFGARIEQFRAGLDVAPRLAECCLRPAEVVAESAAAGLVARVDDRDAEPVEHPGRCRVDAGSEPRLHAAFEQDHATSVRVRRGVRRGRCALAMPGSTGGPRAVRRRRCEAASRAALRAAADAASRRRAAAPRTGAGVRARSVNANLARAGAQRAADSFLGQFAAQLDDASVLHAGRAGCLAGATGEAAIEVGERLRAGRPALDELLHEVDSPARTVELVAQDAVGRAGGQAEAAVHAGAQQLLGLAAARGVLECAGRVLRTSR